jgi:hypothetical protein
MDENAQSGSSPQVTSDDLSPGLSRRGFLGGAASAGVLAGIVATTSGAALPAGTKPVADVLMPDGTAFVSWDQPLAFSKTYYVDNRSPTADDDGPGDRAHPFRTIGKAAAVLMPGERVVIAEGIYRECVRPPRGGTGPGQMISYEAAPGAKVCIRGSEVLASEWTQETVRAGSARPGTPEAPGTTVWRHDLTGAMFPNAYNPFALPSIMGYWSWLDPSKVDMGPYLRRRGLVFVDGKPLEPMEQLHELAMMKLPPVPDYTRPAAPMDGLPPRRRGGPLMQEIGGSPDARFWTDHAGTAVYVRLPSGTPADHMIEITTRQHALLPAKSGIGFIRLKGLTFQHAGNAYPFPQSGMVSLAGGDHWILNGNILEWANGMGLDIGNDENSAGALQTGASIIVRGNEIRYCGVEGVGGMGTTNALIEDNLIEWCGWADAERGWEAAATKFHRAKNMLYRRNVVRHIRHGNGAWWDVDNTNCRVTQNVFADITTVSAAVHFEMTQDPNWIDNNIIWDVRNAEPGTPGQRGCAGSGIFDNASSNLTIAHNLIGRCDNAGIFAIVRADRGRPLANRNEVANNVFARCKSATVFLDRDNKSDGNVYIDMPASFLGMTDGPAAAFGAEGWKHITYVDLVEWQNSYGWDRRSVVVNAQIDFEPTTLTLTMAGQQGFTGVATVHGMEADILRRPTGATRVAGPIAAPGSKRSWVVDPRSKP